MRRRGCRPCHRRRVMPVRPSCRHKYLGRGRRPGGSAPSALAKDAATGFCDPNRGPPSTPHRCRAKTRQTGKAAGFHMDITFLLNGETVTADVAPTATLLDWLRDPTRPLRDQGGLQRGRLRRLHGDGDGAAWRRALNACILFLPQLARQGGAHGRGDRGAGRACTRCSGRWSITTGRNADSARRASWSHGGGASERPHRP